MLQKPFSLALITCCLLWGELQGFSADDWGHWRGPNGTGATTGQPPTEWSETKNVKWKVAIPGRGSGSPVIWGKQVFVVTALPSKGGAGKLSFELHCYDRKSGSLQWRQVAIEETPHQGTHSTNGHASASPCTDGEHVYAHFGSRGLYCYTMDGKQVWSKDFGKMETRNSFGEGSSPTLFDKMILVPWDHEGPSALYALDKLTGKEIWKVDRDEPTCWATPLVVEHQGKYQVVMNGQKSARSYDLETGKEIWRCAGQTERPAATPVAGNGLVYVGSGFRGAFLGAFRLSGQGDIAKTPNVAWSITSDTPDVASPLLSQGRLYFYKEKKGMLSCVDAKTGKPHYMAARVAGLGTIYASPVAAGGHVYLADRNGLVVVIKDSDTLEVVASNSMGEVIDATPAIVDNELYIRGENHLFCIERRSE